MSKFQIKYLNLRAKAEPIRLFLNYVQQPYEDIRENFLEFAKYKDKMPLPKLPKLIIDGKFELCYTSVILAYLGRKFGLEPETDEEKAICAMLAARLEDYMNYVKPFVNSLLGIVPAERASLCEQVFLPCVTRDFAPTFESQLEKCNTGYLVGDSLTWIDFYAACFSDYAVSHGCPDVFDKFPRVQYHRRAVLSLPQLQDHLKNRQETPW